MGPEQRDLADPEALTLWADAHLPGRGPVQVEVLGEGHSNLTSALAARGPRLRAAPAARRAAAADRARRRARAAVLALLTRPSAGPRPARRRGVRGPDGARRALLRDGATSTVRRARTPLPAWLDETSAARPRPRPGARVRGGAPGRPSSRSSLPGSAARTATSTGSCGAGPGSARGSSPRSPPPAGTAPRPARLRRRPRLAGRAPARAESEPAVVHGDAKLDNVVVGAEGGTAGRRGARLGDGHGRRPAGRPRLPALVLAGAGRAASAGRAGHRRRRLPLPGRAGRDLGARAPAGPPATLTWFVTLAIWKLAVLLEARYHRWLAGTTDDPFFASLDAGRARAARARAGDLPVPELRPRGWSSTGAASSPTPWTRRSGRGPTVDGVEFDALHRASCASWLGVQQGDGRGTTRSPRWSAARSRCPHFEEQLAGRLTAVTGHPIEPVGLLQRMFDQFEHAPAMSASCCARTRAGMRTGLLSNSWGNEYPREGWDRDVRRGRHLRRGRHAQAGAADLPPHPRSCSGWTRGESVFVDDLPPNIRAAAALGMVGVLHTSYATTAAELEVLFDQPLAV